MTADGHATDMRERKSLGRSRVDNLCNLHEVDPDQLLHGKNGPEMFRRILQNEVSNLRMESQISLELRNQQGGEDIRIIERVDSSLVCQRLCRESLDCRRKNIPGTWLAQQSSL